MSNLFQRRGRSGSDAGAARLTLGAFGKHPGWDDHILGIGVETETLAQVKQALYVGGIGAQIDSGAWEKLEAEKRLAGFDHTFLWQRPGHVLLGQLWSSTDGKGRSKYPMVLCIDGEGVSPGFMVKTLLSGVQRLRTACQTTNSADQVARDCRSGQDQLRGMLTQDPARLDDSGLTPESPRRFLEHPRLGPDRLGFLRVLHELKAAPAIAVNGRAPGSGTVRSYRSSHLRLPLGAESVPDGLLLWAGLLRCVLPDSVPVLLLVRAGEDWLDVLLNEPAPDDFFCLQAGLKALPLATDIPYQLAPDLRQRWQELETKFLGTGPTASAPAPAPPPARSPQPSAPAPPRTAGPPPAPLPSSPLAPAAPPRSSKLPLVAAVILLVLLGIAAAWYFSRPAQKPATHPGAAATSETVRTEQAYATALAAAHAAQVKKEFSNALAQAGLALQLKPGDAEASQLLQDLKLAASAAAEQEQKYQTATNGAARALLEMNFSEATNQAGLALSAKPADPIASNLLFQAQQALAAGFERQKYQAAFEAAQTAFHAGKFQEALDQATRALGLKKDDPAAAKLLADCHAALQAGEVAAQQQRLYQAATNAAAAALAQTNYQEALKQVRLVLSTRTNDAVALELKSRAETGLDLAAAQQDFASGDYAKALELCRRHAGNDAFSTLATNIASEQRALADANSGVSRGDYALLDSLKANSYAAKPAFARLISQAEQEQATLTSLQSIKQTNGWQELQKRFASAEVVSLAAKPPFAELRSWADAQAAKPAETGEQTLQRLDKNLEILLVQFEVFKPNSPEIKSEGARQTKPIADGVINTGFYLDQVANLEAALRQGGWLDRDNRKAYIEKLRRAINVR